MLREANTAVATATADGCDHLDPQLLTDLRQRYDKAVGWGITTNRHRHWPKGNHPGYNLATRRADKADQVWTFIRNLAGAPRARESESATGCWCAGREDAVEPRAVAQRLVLAYRGDHIAVLDIRADPGDAAEHGQWIRPISHAVQPA